jgi:hypothetical protein
MMIRPDKYPKLERRAGDHVTQRRPACPQRASRPASKGIAAKLTHMSGNYLTHMSGALRGISLFADANYFRAA